MLYNEYDTFSVSKKMKPPTRKNSLAIAVATFFLATSANATSYIHKDFDLQHNTTTQSTTSYIEFDLDSTVPDNIQFFDYVESADVIDMNVLAFYTDELLAYLDGDITEVYAYIEKSIEYNNRALTFNGVAIKRNLAGIVKLPSDFDESKVHEEGLQDVYDPDTGAGYVATYLSGLRDTLFQREAMDERYGSYGASYYAVFASESPIVRVGAAQLGRNISYVSARTSDIEGSLSTLAHELGHNDGLDHDRSSLDFSFSFHLSPLGISAVCDNSGTIMFPSASFGRLPFFSDTNISVEGTNDICGVQDEADVALAYRDALDTGFIERRSGIMTNYRDALPKVGVVSLVMDNTADEENGVIRGTVIWDGLAADQNAFVNVVISDYGTASPSDFTTHDIHIEYTGEGSTDFVIELNDDSDAESNEQVTFSLFAANGVNIDSTQSTDTVTIVSGEQANTGSVSFTQSTVSLNEGSTAVLTLERAGGSTGELTVTVDATFQSASASDVNFTTTTVTFLDGETSKTVSIEALTDSNEESTETLTLTLTGDNIGNNDEVTVSINDATESSIPTPSTPNNGSAGGESGGGSIHFGLIGLALMTLFRKRA